MLFEQELPLLGWRGGQSYKIQVLDPPMVSACVKVSLGVEVNSANRFQPEGKGCS